ncbi:nucleotidyltransferase domain-containing protein [Rheinheimera sp. EpRS3]|uniref:nucleotidyltransferase domain-containing protein n=1 Tax=Rheinheimera sp. EpRS3 TaxID=1712383 RepID=UPI000748C81A|nr:nucleotidyltransferase domain-containing protein [Rheinheimera sp. EpRS3]KUM52490.1 DNA polymerase III subunit beta [Rheinheimera sp. EpRS3]
MRLSEFEKTVIFKAITAEDASARVFLFGSRVDDSACGGDIDLLVLSGGFDKKRQRAARWRILEKLGEQKIDIVSSADGSEPFVKMIRGSAEEITG